jgi:tetratricopeptide (TPR) repeat protein
MLLSRLLPYSALLLALLAASFNVQADDLRDISRLANQGQQEAALKRINIYLGTHPRDVHAMFIKGVILAEQNRRPEAIKVFTDITSKYPTLPEPYNNLAVLYADQGQFDKARQALESAIRTHPSYATAHENLGDIYARMASEAYDKALQLDNGNARTQNKLSLIKDIVPSGSPVQLASRSAISPPVREPVKRIPETATLPIRPAESAKLSESKSSESKSSEAKSSNPKSDASKPEPKVPPLKSTVSKSEPTAALAKVEPEKAVTTKPEPKTEPNPESQQPVAKPNEDKQIMAAVHDWAKAWSSQKVKQYLGSYADNFQPPDGESRKEWEALRRERVTNPASIKVEVAKIRIKMEGSDQAKVSFRQSYRAGKTTMRTSKTLIMRKTGDKWLIEQELTDK